MSDLNSPVLHSGAPDPVVTLKRIRRITTFEIMEADLDALENATSAEQRSLGFFTLLLGMFVPTVISWLTATTVTPTGQATYVSSMIALGVGSLYMCVKWRQDARLRPQLLRRIRSTTETVMEATVPPSPAAR